MPLKEAVLLLAYGTPDNLDDIHDFLLDIRGGRPVSDELMSEMTERYEAIGGPSPLTELTMAQADAIKAGLAEQGIELPVYVGMRHWKPWIHEALEQMMAAGIEHAYTQILAPHACTYTQTTYQKALNKAIEQTGCPISFEATGPWSDRPSLIEAQRDVTRKQLERVPAGAKVKTIFSAHSLPTRIQETGDPYPQDLLANARAIAAGLEGIDWMFAYQSAGAYGGPWLGPDINEIVGDLAKDEYEYIVSVPIGFVCDHLEILFDLDIETKGIAEEHGLTLLRADAMNTHPSFIQAIVEHILDTRR